jgi:phosphatidylethanolamine-binding protein (PEBP) family uncharacterized protein
MPEKKRVSGVLGGPKTIGVQSPAFAPGGKIPKQHTADGDGMSPPLIWLNVPREAISLALLVEDPDASTPQPFVHWVAYNIPAGSEGLPEGIAAGDRPGRPALLDLPDGATRGSLAKAMRGHLLATGELVGTYSRDD